jgi:hypothetical protein
VKERRAKIRENKMDRFSFGPRDNSIIQIAYSVADIQEEMRRYTELLHIGPWFLVGPFVPPKGVYRGAVTKMRVSLAFAYSGELMIELIEQHDKEPSVFQETLKARRTAFIIGRSARATSKKPQRITARVDTSKHSRIPPQPHWGAASSISTPGATCPACSKSSR